MTFEQLRNSLPKIDSLPEVSDEILTKQLGCILDTDNKTNQKTIWDDKKLEDFDISSLTKDAQAVLSQISQNNKLIYGMVAPAFLGQFSADVTPGKLRSALKFIGFSGMPEVSLFADILTLKEALEFNEKINDESDFMLTSCCCPVWIAMLRKANLLSHVPGSVSPMIAAGRPIKIIHHDAVNVFIGPCMAKKNEMNEPDLKGAVDYVLTFQEIASIFDLLGVNPADMPEDDSEHSSRAGRIYARAGGVSQAIIDTIKRLNPDKKIISKQANGVVECKKLIEEFADGTAKEKYSANFYEGMGCIGGCVGGPKKIIDKDLGKQNVDDYAQKAVYPTPIDNPYVIKLLSLLGFDTVESLLADNKIFSRNFSD